MSNVIFTGPGFIVLAVVAGFVIATQSGAVEMHDGVAVRAYVPQVTVPSKDEAMEIAAFMMEELAVAA